MHRLADPNGQSFGVATDDSGQVTGSSGSGVTADEIRDPTKGEHIWPF